MSFKTKFWKSVLSVVRFFIFLLTALLPRFVLLPVVYRLVDSIFRAISTSSSQTLILPKRRTRLFLAASLMVARSLLTTWSTALITASFLKLSKLMCALGASIRLVQLSVCFVMDYVCCTQRLRMVSSICSLSPCLIHTCSSRKKSCSCARLWLCTHVRRRSIRQAALLCEGNKPEQLVCLEEMVDVAACIMRTCVALAALHDGLVLVLCKQSKIDNTCTDDVTPRFRQTRDHPRHRLVHARSTRSSS